MPPSGNPSLGVGGRNRRPSVKASGCLIAAGRAGAHVRMCVGTAVRRIPEFAVRTNIDMRPLGAPERQVATMRHARSRHLGRASDSQVRGKKQPYSPSEASPARRNARPPHGAVASRNIAKLLNVSIGEPFSNVSRPASPKKSGGLPLCDGNARLCQAKPLEKAGIA